MKTLTDSFRHIRETYKKVSSDGVNIKSKAQE